MLPGKAKVEAASAAQEIDLWWGGYSGWTMLPSFIVCGLLTLGILGGAVYFWYENMIGEALARYEVYALAGAVWLFQLSRWGHRMIGFGYRLTTRRLFVSKGWLHAAVPPIDIRDVRQVRVLQSPLERWLRVGRIHLLAKVPPYVLLKGVGDPQRIADLIERVARR